MQWQQSIQLLLQQVNQLVQVSLWLVNPTTMTIPVQIPPSNDGTVPPKEQPQRVQNADGSVPTVMVEKGATGCQSVRLGGNHLQTVAKSSKRLRPDDNAPSQHTTR